MATRQIRLLNPITHFLLSSPCGSPVNSCRRKVTCGETRPQRPPETDPSLPPILHDLSNSSNTWHNAWKTPHMIPPHPPHPPIVTTQIWTFPIPAVSPSIPHRSSRTHHAICSSAGLLRQHTPPPPHSTFPLIPQAPPACHLFEQNMTWPRPAVPHPSANPPKTPNSVNGTPPSLPIIAPAPAS